MVPARDFGLYKTHTDPDVTVNAVLRLGGSRRVVVHLNSGADGSNVSSSHSFTQLSMTWTLSQNF